MTKFTIFQGIYNSLLTFLSNKFFLILLLFITISKTLSLEAFSSTSIISLVFPFIWIANFNFIFFLTSSADQFSHIHKVSEPRLDQISSLICGTNGCKIIDNFFNDQLKSLFDNFFFKRPSLRMFTNSYILATDLLNWKLSILSETWLIINLRSSIKSGLLFLDS